MNGIPGEDDRTSAAADVTVTIRDVNDEAPKFNRREYEVTIPENVPFGTPLANLDMEVKDTDTGPNALFKVSERESMAGKEARTRKTDRPLSFLSGRSTFWTGELESSRWSPGGPMLTRRSA